MRKFKVKCLNCDIRFVATNERHHMFNCPKCGITAVDIEEFYNRFVGNIRVEEEFLSPFFELEEEYHSALLSFLNDSDEIWTLFKINKMLYMEKLQ